MHIGILGGSFNPVHNDHIKLLEYIKNKLQLDSFILIPNALPPHKNTCKVSFSDRVNMLSNLELSSSVNISDIEADESIAHYSFDTINELKKLYKNDTLYFCMGMDSFNYLDKWKNGLAIPTLCNIVVTDRVGYSLESSNELVKEKLFNKIITIDDKDENLDKSLSYIKDNTDTKIIYLKKEFSDISSSKIRNIFTTFYENSSIIDKNFENFIKFDSNSYITQHLPISVIKYILENKIYANTTK